jgi:hypothetical protein
MLHFHSRLSRQTTVSCLGTRLTSCLLGAIDFLHVLLFVLASFAYLCLRYLFLGLASADISSSSAAIAQLDISRTR